MLGKNRNPELRFTIGNPGIAKAYFGGMLAVASTRHSWLHRHSRIRAENQSLKVFDNDAEFPVDIWLPRKDAAALRQSLIGIEKIIDTTGAEEELAPSVKALIGELATRLDPELNDLSVSNEESHINASWA